MTTTSHGSGTEARQLRPYQLEAVAAVERDWATGVNRVGVVLPTGAGKSTVIGQLAANAWHRGKRVVMLAHRGELLDQMVRDLKAVAPWIPDSDIGIVRAEVDDHHCPIVAASLQTLSHARRLKSLGERDVILWDEVHHAGAEGFHATFQDLGGYREAQMAGFTATMRRAQQGRIGLGDVIQKISYTKDLRWAIESGFLIKPKGLTVRLDDLNALDDVRTIAGDFAQGEMAAVMEAATSYVVDAVRMHAADRRPIIFAASVEAARSITERLNEVGYPAVAVTGDMSYEDRQEHYHAFRMGTVRALVTVMVLTEGADFPMCDCVVLARPTRSANLYSQMIGRALRLYDGKEDALVLDLAGSTRQMRLTSLPQILPGVESRVVGGDGTEIIDPEPEEATTEEERTVLRPVRQRRRGPVEMVTIDLLTGRESQVLWLETPAGVPFIPLTDGWVVFLWPKDATKGADTYAVGNINTRTRAGGWMGGEEVYLSTQQAIDFAEASVAHGGFTLPRRAGGWRESQPPSEAQLRYARSLGIPEYEDMTKARLSDEISVALAKRLLDPNMKKDPLADVDVVGEDEGVA